MLILKTSQLGKQKKPLLISVSKAVSKKATERNRLKRRLRAILSLYVKEKKREYTVIAKPGVANLSFSELKEKVEGLLKTK